MKVLGKMCLIILLKATQKQSFTLSLKDTFSKKPQGWGIKMSPSLFKIKEDVEYNPGLIKLISIKFLKRFFEFFKKNAKHGNRAPKNNFKFKNLKKIYYTAKNMISWILILRNWDNRKLIFKCEIQKLKKVLGASEKVQSEAYI